MAPIGEKMSRLNIKELGLSFPNGKLPSVLSQLCQFQEYNKSYAYSGDFIIENDAVEFIEDLPQQESFAGFGSNATGGVFAIWSGNSSPLPTVDLDSYPVVYLDSEAVYSSVVCKDLFAFIALLLIGIDDLGGRVAQDLELEPSSSHPEALSFRKWADLTFGIKVPTSPREIVNAAKLEFQDSFIDWYIKWQGEAPWTKRI